MVVGALPGPGICVDGFSVACGRDVSLWKEARNPLTGRYGWMRMVLLPERVVAVQGEGTLRRPPGDRRCRGDLEASTVRPTGKHFFRNAARSAESKASARRAHEGRELDGAPEGPSRVVDARFSAANGRFDAGDRLEMT